MSDREPVEAIEAVHAWSGATADFPGWASSAAHRLTANVAHAAAQRLPGYAEASWWWRRPSQPAVPIGLHGTWCPNVAGVTRSSLPELLQRWSGADVMVLTVEALKQLPAGLPPRTKTTYILTRPGGLSPDQWTSASTIGQPVLVELPTAAAWLEQRLRQAGPELDGQRNAPVDHTNTQARPDSS